MNFKVQITDTAADKIQQLDVPNTVKVAILQAILRDMSALERLNGIRSVAPVRFHTHRVVFICPETGDRLKYLIWVDDCYEVEGTRIVKDASRIMGDTPYFGMQVLHSRPALPIED